MGIVDAYVLSQSTTYFWDTCGCHAILKSLNGNIWNYEKCMNREFTAINYFEKEAGQKVEQYKNKYGFIACRDESLMRKIILALQWSEMNNQCDDLI